MLPFMLFSRDIKAGGTVNKKTETFRDYQGFFVTLQIGK